MKRTTIILNIILGLIVLIFLLDFFTSFDIKNQTVKSFIYFGFLIGTPIILFWNLFSKQTLLIIYPVLLLVLIIIINPLRILYQKTGWQTYIVFYKHKNKNCKTIEFQMQDTGDLGFNKREVEVSYLTPLFIITREISPNIDHDSDWIEVNENINESGLKFP